MTEIEKVASDMIAKIYRGLPTADELAEKLREAIRSSSLSVNEDKNGANEINWNEYPRTLRPKHIQEILGRSQRKTYEFLNDNPPFHVAVDGNEKFISKTVFREWLEGKGGGE